MLRVAPVKRAHFFRMTGSECAADSAPNSSPVLPVGVGLNTLYFIALRL